MMAVDFHSASGGLAGADLVSGEARGEAQADASAYFRKGEPGGRAVLLLHGLTASPTEVRPIADFLAERDAAPTVSCPLLPGHGTTPEDLRRTTPADWRRAVADGIASLCADRDGVAVIGVSMGAVLAAEAAIHDPRVRSLVMLAPVFDLPWARAAVLRAMRYVKPYVRKSRESLANHRAKGLFSYDRYPVESLLHLGAIGRSVRRELHRLAVPTLLAAGRLDRYVRWRSIERLRDELLRNVEPGFRLEFVACPRSGHVLPHEPDAPTLLATVRSFLAGRVAASASVR